MESGVPQDKSRHPDRAMRQRLITVYGRKAALEALRDPQLSAQTLHLAESNKPGGIVREILAAAQTRNIAVKYHSREALSRISRNGRQDQGVALDVRGEAMCGLEEFLVRHKQSRQALCLIALDGVTNPQNMGMAIRSASAAGLDGILYADQGNPALGPLVIKASAGTVFQAPLLRCRSVSEGIEILLAEGFTLYRLQASSSKDLFHETLSYPAVFVLGSETDGVSAAVSALQGHNLRIPMTNNVESLNVAVSAALVAYTAVSAR
ncbi:MAG: RNA methyltransferase [Congregibacter sp.]